MDIVCSISLVSNETPPTVSFGHPLRDLHQDPCIAADHDGQRYQEEANESKHIVDGLLPVFDKAPSSGALSEIGWHRDGHVVKQEHLLGNSTGQRLQSQLLFKYH